MRVVALVFVVSLLLPGCGAFQGHAPLTQGDPANASPYGYNPIDPLPVEVMSKGKEKPTNNKLLEALPDETMRIAVGEVKGNAGISFGMAKAGIAGSRYVIILDYAKFETRTLGVNVDNSTGKSTAVLTRQGIPQVLVPVYVGVGLRLTADVFVREGTVDLGNLFALGAAAAEKRISGTMVVQTLGISGETISTMIPIPSEINTTTIQNALVAIGAMKAKIYDQKTDIRPRVLGVYNNLGGGQERINSFISSLLEQRLSLFLD